MSQLETLSQYALVSVYDLASYLNIPEANLEDEYGYTGTYYQLEWIINAATSEIETICDRVFVARRLREWYTTDSFRFSLYHYPVQNVIRMSSGIDNAMQIAYNGSGIDYRPGITSYGQSFDSGITTNGAYLEQTDAMGNITTNEFDFSQYKSVLALANAVNALNNGWTATVMQNVATKVLYPQGCINWTGGTYFVYPNVELTYRYEPVNGTISLDFAGFLFNWPADPPWISSNKIYPMGTRYMNVLVEYDAGIAVVPDVVKQVCLEIGAEIYFKYGQDPTLNSEKIGDYAYTRDLNKLLQLRSDRLRPFMRLR